MREPLRVMALHSPSYCERLYYLEEVEGLLVADDRVYAGRELHESLAGDEEQYEHVETLHLASEAIGLQGKVDAVKRRDGAWTPYEHKRGRCRRVGGGKGRAARADKAVGLPGAWETDALQVAAYAMLLEEHLGVPVAEGRVHYHADNVTVRVPVDDAMRDGCGRRWRERGSCRPRSTDRRSRTTRTFAAAARSRRSACPTRRG